VAEAAHHAGNKAIVYIAGAECITANANNSAHTAMKDDPEWVQGKITEEPAVFTHPELRFGFDLGMKMCGSVRVPMHGGCVIWSECDR
jgi:hypothetical protein